MMKTFGLAIIVALLMSLKVEAAQYQSQNKKEFCADRKSKNFIKDLTLNSDNLMSFRNQGGIGNGGVCWWHSRFQRNALYLTIFNPSKDFPSPERAKEIIKEIRKGKKVIEIGGFRNFAEFTSAYFTDIQDELNRWQKNDGITKFNWVIGLAGQTAVAPEELESKMNDLYNYVVKGNNIAYQKLQMKGVVAHAWLVVNMSKTPEGYDLEVIDSNFPRSTNVYRYTKGMINFNHYHYGEFVPYLERTKELSKIKEVVSQNCK